MTVYVGPFRSIDGPQGPGTAWAPPAGATATLELRSRPGHATAGKGLFECPANPGAGYSALADGPLDTVAPAQRASLATSLGITIVQTRLGDIVREIMSQGDPTGAARWSPVRLGPGRIVAAVGTFLPQTVADDGSPEWLAHVEMLKLEYAATRAACSVLPSDVPQYPGGLDRISHLRLLSKWTRQFGLGPTGYRQFLGGLPDEGKAPERTNFTINFTGADSDTVVDGGWTERGSDWDNVSNRCVFQSGSGSDYNIYRTTWGGGADYYVQAVVNAPSGFSYEGIGLRWVAYSSSDGDAYWALATGSNFDLWKKVSGSFTQIESTGQTMNSATDYTFKLVVSGTSLTRYLDGVQKGTTKTDSALSAAGTAAMRTNGGSGQQFDDYTADDGAGGGGAAVPVFEGHYRRMR